MKQHPFDPVAFVFGLLFVAVGVPLLFSESGLTALEGRWVFPAFLIIAGGIVLGSTRRRERAEDDMSAQLEGSDDDSLYR
jgi:hypothetical protein